MKRDLDMLRAEIDRLDDQIVRLLNERAALAIEIGAIKHAQGEALYAPQRERRVLSRVMERNAGPMSQRAVCRIYAEIMGAALALEHQRPVIAAGADPAVLKEAVRYMAGERADAHCLASLDDGWHAWHAHPDALLVVTDDGLERLRGRALGTAQWTGSWWMTVAGLEERVRCHVIARPGADDDTSHPACLGAVVMHDGPLPPDWLAEIPARSCEYVPWPGESRRGLVVCKMEMNARDARAAWLDLVSARAEAAWIS